MTGIVTDIVPTDSRKQALSSWDVDMMSRIQDLESNVFSLDHVVQYQRKTINMLRSKIDRIWSAVMMAVGVEAMLVVLWALGIFK